MSWPTVKLGDVMTVGRGSSPRPIKDERFFTGGAIPWVKIADATASGKFIFRTNEYVNEYGASFSRRLQPGSLIFPASGTLGIPRFLGVEACIHDGWLYFSDYNGIDPDWLYYRLILLKSYYESIAYGAAIQNINTEIVRNTEIQLPDIKTQQSISAVIKTYDDLIENNHRRITLLEESGKLLYREWFVNLRFPGHESHPCIDGIPEGWGRKSITEMVQINPKTPFDKDCVYPFVPMQALSESSMVIEGTEERVISGGAKFQNQDTLLARITPCLENGKTGFVQFLDEDKPVASGSTEFIVMRGATVSPYWVYYTARDESFREHAIGSMVGSDGRQRVNSKCFDSYFAWQPPQNMLNEFNEAVEPMFKEIQVLACMSQRLREARDALLPKLMSGEVQV